VVDRDLALRKIAAIEEYLQQLSEYRNVGLDEYRSDWKTQRVVERTLHLAIEACMDLADHIVADRRLRVPDTGSATFEILADAGVVSAELGRSVARMVGFRNILVHTTMRGSTHPRFSACSTATSTTSHASVALCWVKSRADSAHPSAPTRRVLRAVAGPPL